VPRKERVSLTLDPRTVREIRDRFPGAPLSQAVALLLEKALLADAFDRRLRSLDMVCRAVLLMLAEERAGGDDAGTKRLLNSYTQKVLARMRELEARKRADQERADPGPEEG